MTRLYFLAIYPSRISVKPANKKMLVAYNKLLEFREKKTIRKTGISTNLKSVSKFGMAIMIPFFLCLIYIMSMPRHMLI